MSRDAVHPDGGSRSSSAATAPAAEGVPDEGAIGSFWNDHPCGDHLVGGLHDRHHGDLEAFLTAYDTWRYGQESHVLRCLDTMGLDRRGVDGLEVLEIGLGQGAESEQLIRRGARWTGLDLTDEAVERTRARLHLRGLPYRDVRRGSVLSLPFPDQSFDLVFSHGVLHHVPDIEQAQAEIARVLRPGGVLVAMLYARRSLNYALAIAVVRRAAILVTYPWWRLGVVRSERLTGVGTLLGDHLRNARASGVRRYLRLDTFTHRSTDGPHNPYAVVYDRARVERDFPAFAVVRAEQHYLHAPPLPTGWVRRRPRLAGMLERRWGWHLWVHLQPRTDRRPVAVEVATDHRRRHEPPIGVADAPVSMAG